MKFCPPTILRWEKASKNTLKPTSFLCRGVLPLRNTVSNKRYKLNTDIIHYLFFSFLILFIQSSTEKSKVPKYFSQTLHCEQIGKHTHFKMVFCWLLYFSNNFKTHTYWRQVVVQLHYIISLVAGIMSRTYSFDLMKLNRKLLWKKRRASKWKEKLAALI